MQFDSSVQLAGIHEIDQAQFTRRLHALLARVSSLQVLVQDGDDEELTTSALDLPALRLGLRELEQLVGELLYTAQTGDALFLAELPGLPLAEALSQQVEATAEKLALSSRIAFAGRERPLPDYLSRLLYRITQEALAQVTTHTGARRLRFNLDYRRSEIVMSLEDDGVPPDEGPVPFATVPAKTTTFPPFLTPEHEEHASTLLSAQTMRQLRDMIEELGGALTITSGIEPGTQLQVRVPYAAPELVNTPDPLPRPAGTIRLLIVDAQAVSRAGLRRLLESYPDLEVVGEAGEGVQAVSETAELLPHLVLIDAHLEAAQSLEILRQVKQLSPEIRTLLLAEQEDEKMLYEALRAGASGYLLKNVAPDELARAIRAVARGEVLIQPQMAAHLLTRFGNQESGHTARSMQETLTAREQEVLVQLGHGLRNKEIAARLFVSERTVNFHLANIYAKLHVSGRTEALSRALEQGLLKV